MPKRKTAKCAQRNEQIEEGPVRSIIRSLTASLPSKMGRGGSYEEAEESRFPVSFHDSEERWSGHYGGHVWDRGNNSEEFTHGDAESESLVEQDRLEKVWNWSVEVSSRVWDKVEPILIEVLPEDKNPFWSFGVFVFVLFFVIAGLRIGPKQGGDIQEVSSNSDKRAKKPVDVPASNFPHLRLPDGRLVVYREQGVVQELAQYTVFVIHGFPSSRIAGIPGVKNSLLEEFGVRLITYDRPGFGESNIHRRQSLQTFTDDLSVIADILHVDKFWLIGYSTGGIYAWAAMKYIPHRLEGVGLFAPGGNVYSPNFTKQESSQIWGSMSFRRKLLYRVARWVPSLLPFVCKRMLVGNVEKLLTDYLVITGKDQVFMQQNFFMKAVTTDMEQSVRQGDAATIAHELSIQVHPWGFDLSDFRIRKRVPPSGIFHRVRRLWKQEEEVWEGFNAPIHIWQGMEDQIVPYAINEYAARMVPQAILHKLEGEGHFTYFWFCDKCHRNIFLTLFKEPRGGRVAVPEPSAPIDLDRFLQTYEHHIQR